MEKSGEQGTDELTNYELSCLMYKVFKGLKVRWVAVCQRGAMDSASDF